MKNVTLKEAWTGHADCRNCAIRQGVLFAGLSQADFETVHRPVDQYRLREGDLIYREGDGGQYLYTIRGGLVKLVRYLPDGTQRIIRLLRSTDVTGLELMIGQAYGHTAVVLQPTELCRLPVDEIKRLSLANARLYQELMARWQRALGNAEHSITQFATGAARQRVARMLIWLVNENPDNRCHLFGREDVGALLGITTETASRTVAEFKRLGYVTEDRANSFVCDIPALQRLLDE